MKKPRRPAPPKPPAHLDADARSVWRTVVAFLSSRGVLLSVDLGTVENYATSMARLRRLNRELDKAPLLDADGKPNPLLRTIEATSASCKNLAHVLGLNPVARKSLPPAATQAGEDPIWRGVLR